MCSNGAPLDLVKHVVLTEFLVKILRERAVICRESFLFSRQLSNRIDRRSSSFLPIFYK